MQPQPLSIASAYAQVLAAARKLSPVEQDNLLQALALEREAMIDADARQVARRIRSAGARISQADIDAEVEAVRSHRYAAGHHR